MSTAQSLLTQTGAASVEIARNGQTLTLAVAPGQTILQAADSQGLDLPHGCRNGACGQCRARLVAGEVDMPMNFALDENEVARGEILTCQALPRSPALRLVFDV